MDVVIHQAEHLRLLERAHAPGGAGHENPHAFFAAHGVFSGAAGVAAGGAKNVQLFAATCKFVFKQIAQQLHGHVFERQRGAIGQSFEKHAIFEFFQGHNFFAAKHFLRVGFRTNRLQIGSGNVVNVERQNLEGQHGVTLVAENHAQFFKRGGIHLRVTFRQVQTTIGGQAFKQDLAEFFSLLRRGLHRAGRKVVHSGRYRSSSLNCITRLQLLLRYMYSRLKG